MCSICGDISRHTYVALSPSASTKSALCRAGHICKVGIGARTCRVDTCNSCRVGNTVPADSAAADDDSGCCDRVVCVVVLSTSVVLGVGSGQFAARGLVLAVVQQAHPGI